MKKKVILVIGSKPDAIIPKFDAAYCANAAGSFYQNELIRKNMSKDNIISIVSSSELVKNMRQDAPEKDEWLKEKFYRIAEFKSSEIILLAHNIFPSAKNNLLKFNSSLRIHTQTVSDTIHLQKKILGLSEPILSLDHLSGAPRNIAGDLANFIQDKFKAFKDSNHLSSGLYRPSTGILALLYAIDKFGINVKYVVSGIGISQRGFYPDNFNNTWTPKKSLEKYHVLVDKKICKLISKKFDVDFTDPTFR